MNPLPTDALGNRRSIQLSYGTDGSNRQEKAENTLLPHTLATPESATPSTVGARAAKLNGRPRWHVCLFMASMSAQPAVDLFGSARAAVAATRAQDGIVWGPGVYFLMRGGHLLYVGQSKNVGKRMAGHASKEPDEVWTLEVAERHLLDAESNFIAILCPPLNRLVDPYPSDWLITRRIEMGIATAAEKASLDLPNTFAVGDAPQIFGDELGRNPYLHADRITSRTQAQWYLNELRRHAMGRALRSAAVSS